MKTPASSDISFMMDSSVYFVAKHYGLSIPEVRAMTEQEFEDSFAFGVAAERIKADEMEKATKDAKSGTKVGPSEGQPFPYE